MKELKFVATTFLLVCFLSLKESFSETRKSNFYFTSKTLFVLRNQSVKEIWPVFVIIRKKKWFKNSLEAATWTSSGPFFVCADCVFLKLFTDMRFVFHTWAYDTSRHLKNEKSFWIEIQNIFPCFTNALP